MHIYLHDSLSGESLSLLIKIHPPPLTLFTASKSNLPKFLPLWDVHCLKRQYHKKLWKFEGLLSKHLRSESNVLKFIFHQCKPQLYSTSKSDLLAVKKMVSKKKSFTLRNWYLTLKINTKNKQFDSFHHKKMFKSVFFLQKLWFGRPY
jgi:hypothetical protein